MCEDESDLVASASGNGVYGGGEPRMMKEDLDGSTMGGDDGVKRKERVGKGMPVAVDARLRVWVLMTDDGVRLRNVGEAKVVAELLPPL
jgi:hypothetical protein